VPNDDGIVGVFVLHEHFILDILPDNGDPISLSSVREQLSEKIGRPLSDPDFDNFVSRLGHRVIVDIQKSELSLYLPVTLPETIENERDLEGWFERYLHRQASDQFFDYKPPSLSLVVQNTARTGINTGPFTKPDICMASVSRFHYSPIAHFNLYSFELKLPQGCNAKSVMQAKAYTDFAHYCYVAIHLPTSSNYTKNLSNMIGVASSHGIGIVRISDHAIDEGYEILVPARRHEPNPGTIDNFIEDRFDEANRQALKKWVRR
jgi:hypothetical protein